MTYVIRCQQTGGSVRFKKVAREKVTQSNFSDFLGTASQGEVSDGYSRNINQHKVLG